MPEPAAALDPEPPLPSALLAHPGVQALMPGRVVGEALDRKLTAELVDDADRERALVRIDPDEHHLDLRSVKEYDRAERRARMRRASQAPYLSLGASASCGRGGLCASGSIWLGCARAPDLILVRGPVRVGDEMVNRVVPNG